MPGGGLKLPEGVTDKPVTMLKSEKVSELGGTVMVENRLDTMLGGGEPEPEVTVTSGDWPGIVPWAGNTIVVFRAGHPEDPASRRTSGQAYTRESTPFQTTAG